MASLSVKKLKSQNCGTYYKWSGTEYQSKGAKDLKQEVKFGKLKLPTKATLNLYGSKLFYFSGGTNAIYCYDLETQKHVCVEVPYQIIGGKKIWDYTDIVYTKGTFPKIRYKTVYISKFNNRIRRKSS